MALVGSVKVNGGAPGTGGNQGAYGNVILADAGGHVGIATTSPTAKLHVSGTNVIQVVEGTGTTSYIKLTNSAHGPGSQGFQIQSTSNDAYFTNYPNGRLFFYANGAPSLSMLANGDVGVGSVQAPASRLDIGDGALTLAEMTAPGAPGSNGCVIYAEDNGSGKTRLMVRFASGAAQQIAIEP